MRARGPASPTAKTRESPACSRPRPPSHVRTTSPWVGRESGKCRSGAVGDTASGDHRFDAALPEQATVLAEDVAPVGVQVPRLAAGACRHAPEDHIKQG
jgi:hypothetical protein